MVPNSLEGPAPNPTPMTPPPINFRGLAAILTDIFNFLTHSGTHSVSDRTKMYSFAPSQRPWAKVKLGVCFS